MALSTYAELQAAVRTELDIATTGLADAVIVDAIARAEAKVCRKARLRNMEQLSTATLGSTSRYVALPTDFLELLDLRIKLATEADTEYEEAIYKAPAQLVEHYQSAGDDGDWYYTVRDQLEFNRVPASDHTLLLHYLKRWNLAVDLTNWLLTNFPDVYFYGTLAECETHLRHDERMPMWKTLFQEGIRELNSLDHRGRDDVDLDISDVVGLSRNSRYNILLG